MTFEVDFEKQKVNTPTRISNLLRDFLHRYAK